MRSEAVLLRRSLVRRLRERGMIRSAAVAAAFETVARDAFLPGVPLREAYRDEAIVIKRAGERPISSSSQPSMMATMLEQLELAEGMRVLEIGTGSGYNAALLSAIVGRAGHVTSVDLETDLADAARRRLRELGCGNVAIAAGDAQTLPFAADAFDRILLTVAAREVLPAWFRALRSGGRIVLPLEFGVMQLSVAFDRSEGRLAGRSSAGAAFMHLRGATQAAREPLAVGDVPRVAVLYGGTPALDRRELWNLLRGGGRPESAPQLGRGEDRVHDLGVWLDVRRELLSVSAFGDAVRLGLVPTIAEPAANFALTFGTARSDGLALMERGDAGLLRLRVYGAPEAADDLRAGISDWLAAGRPSLAALHVDIEFERGPAPPPGTIVAERPHCALLLRWASEADT